MKKELQRSRSNRVIAGVCGGIGEYFNIDPVLVRVLAVVLGLGSFGTLVILYLLLAFIIPLES